MYLLLKTLPLIFFMISLCPCTIYDFSSFKGGDTWNYRYSSYGRQPYMEYSMSYNLYVTLDSAITSNTSLTFYVHEVKEGINYEITYSPDDPDTIYDTTEISTDTSYAILMIENNIVKTFPPLFPTYWVDELISTSAPDKYISYKGETLGFGSFLNDHIMGVDYIEYLEGYGFLEEFDRFSNEGYSRNSTCVLLSFNSIKINKDEFFPAAIAQKPYEASQLNNLNEVMFSSLKSITAFLHAYPDKYEFTFYRLNGQIALRGKNNSDINFRAIASGNFIVRMMNDDVCRIFQINNR